MTAEVLRLPTARRRRENYTGAEHCGACDDTGQVVTGTESRPHPHDTNRLVAFEVVGPCPFCERGFRLEFGLGRTKEGREYENPRGGPWGPEGFWKGRPIPDGLA